MDQLISIIQPYIYKELIYEQNFELVINILFMSKFKFY